MKARPAWLRSGRKEHSQGFERETVTAYFSFLTVVASAGVDIDPEEMLATVSLVSVEAVVSRFIGQAAATETESPRAAASAKTVFMVRILCFDTSAGYQGDPVPAKSRLS